MVLRFVQEMSLTVIGEIVAIIMQLQDGGATSPNRRIYRLLGIAVLATGLILGDAAGAAELQSPLTLASAQRLAVERSRQRAAQAFAVTAAREMAIAAGERPDPVVRIGIDNLPVSGSDRFSLTRDFMTMGRVGIMQELTRAQKLQTRAARYEREADRAVAESEALSANIERDAAIAWLDRYYAEAMSAVIAEVGEQARLEVEAAEGAYRGGRGAQADVFAARGALASFDDRASEARRRVQSAKTMLARWVGDTATVPLAAEPSMQTVRLDAATLEQNLAHHPQIAVLDKRAEVARADARIAQANKQSDWTIELAYQQRGPSYSNMVSVGLSIPWQWDAPRRQDRDVSAKLAMVEQIGAERDEALRVHVAETQVLINEWENGRERRLRYQRELIPLAEARTQAATAAYRGGKSSLADVLLARRNEIDVRILALQLDAETARLWAQLNFLVPSKGWGPHSGAGAQELKK